MIERLVGFALTQRVLVLAVTVGLIASGIWASSRLAVDAFPDISVPQVQVIVKAPGLSPVEVEQRITRPIETAVRGIPNQTTLRSVSKYALSTVTIDFDEGVDVYWARQQVSERLNQVWSELPAAVEGGLAPITTPLGEAFMFTVEGAGYSDTELRTLLDWTIRPRLLSVDGVAEVNALGGEVRTFEVLPSPEKLDALDLELSDVGDAIAANNRNAGGDRLVRAGEVLLVRSVGRLRDERDIAAVTITTRDGFPIRVGDVAEVRIGAQTRFGGVTKDGIGEHVQGLVLTRMGANSRRCIAAVKVVLDDVRATLPPGVKIVPFYDRTDLVERSTTMVRNALGFSCLLVVLVLLAFLGDLRAAFSVALVLPLTVLITLLVMYGLGMTANLMSMGGIAIAIGILVDPAVVVVENVQAQLGRMRPGEHRIHRIYRAVCEVGPPVVSGTAIIVIVFLPILSLTGLEGRMFAPLAEAISIALVIAVLIALIVVPVVASFVLRTGHGGQSKLTGLIARVHRPLVSWAMRRRWLAVAVGMLLFIPGGLAFLGLGAEFMPTLNEGTLVIQTSKLPSISLARSMEIDGELQRRMMELPEVLHVVSRVGSDELRLDPMGLHETDHYLVTRPRDEWSFENEEALVAALREKMSLVPGVTFGFTQPIEMRTSEMITGVRAALAVKLFGTDIERLERNSAELERLVASTRGAVDVMRAPLRGQTYLEIHLDPIAMGRFGVTGEAVNRLIEGAIAGREVTKIVEEGRRTPVVVRLPEDRRDTAEAIGRLRVHGVVDDVGGVTLEQIATIVEVDGPVQLDHGQGLRHVVIQANVEGRDIVGLVDELRRAVDERLDLPPGSFVEFGGEFESQQRASRRLAIVVPVAIASIFLILFSTFRSLRQAILILLNIPFALIGGICALWVAGLYLSVPASVGFIALFGTAIMNGVVLVTHFNELREAGMALEEAVRRGVERRLQPVLMTAVTTGFGLLPLLLATGPGSEIQRPLAIVVLGGLGTSTLLTLVLLPSLYAWIEGRAERRVSPPLTAARGTA